MSAVVWSKNTLVESEATSEIQVGVFNQGENVQPAGLFIFVHSC